MIRTHQTAWGPVRQNGPWTCVNDLLSWTEWWTVGTEAFEDSIRTVGEVFDHWARPDSEFSFRATRCGVHCLDAIRMEGNDVWIHCLWADLLLCTEYVCEQNFDQQASELVKAICDELFPDREFENDDDDDDEASDESWLPELNQWR